ncbi:hypothetical protein [Streptomyces sp. NPDC002851]
MPTAAEARRKTAAAQEKQDKKVEQEQAGHVLHMHTAHPAVPVPYFTPQDLKATAQEMTSRLPTLQRKNLLERKDLLFYGGLGALTVGGALEWPIALAVGGATWVVRDWARREAEERLKEAAGSGKTKK